MSPITNRHPDRGCTSGGHLVPCVVRCTASDLRTYPELWLFYDFHPFCALVFTHRVNSNISFQTRAGELISNPFCGRPKWFANVTRAELESEDYRHIAHNWIPVISLPLCQTNRVLTDTWPTIFIGIRSLWDIVFLGLVHTVATTTSCTGKTPPWRTFVNTTHTGFCCRVVPKLYLKTENVGSGCVFCVCRKMCAVLDISVSQENSDSGPCLSLATFSNYGSKEYH